MSTKAKNSKLANQKPSLSSKPSSKPKNDPFEYDDDASAFEGVGRPISDGEHVVRLSRPENNADPASFDWTTRDDEGNTFDRTDWNIPYQLEIIDEADQNFGRKGFGRFSTMPQRTVTGKRTTEAGSIMRLAGQKASWDPESDARSVAKILEKSVLNVLARSTWVTRIQYDEDADSDYKLMQKKVTFRKGEKRHPVDSQGNHIPLTVVEEDTDFEIKVEGKKQKITVPAGTPLVTRAEWNGFRAIPEE